MERAMVAWNSAASSANAANTAADRGDDRDNRNMLPSNTSRAELSQSYNIAPRNTSSSSMSTAVSSVPFGMTMQAPAQASEQGQQNRSPWQEKLQEYCQSHLLQPPVYSIVSDRRGGRTAWSCTCTIEKKSIAARFWYDGQFLNNAKEDAAERALAHALASHPVNDWPANNTAMMGR